MYVLMERVFKCLPLVLGRLLSVASKPAYNTYVFILMSRTTVCNTDTVIYVGMFSSCADVDVGKDTCIKNQGTYIVIAIIVC